MFSSLPIWNVKVHNTIFNTNNSKNLISIKIDDFLFLRFIGFEIV